jgi:hypothetical protein
MFAFLATILCPRAVAAQEMATPTDIQIPLFTRIMMFDRALLDRAGDEIVLGIVYQDRFRASVRSRDEVRETLRSKNIQEMGGRPLRTVLIDASDGDEARLARRMVEEGVDLLYIAPLRAFDLDSICDIGRENDIVTFTGVPEYVSGGVAVGLDVRGGKPQILINRAAAEDQGADFSSELLKLAEIIEPS